MAKFDPTKSPTALFCALETAIRRGNLERAAALKNQLKGLGYTVTVRLHTSPRSHRTTNPVPQGTPG